MNSTCKKNCGTDAGFSLVELLVVVSIFVIMTSIVLYNQNKFSSDISISNASYEVALEIRQAQIYGTLVREGEVGGEFDAAYGMHFKTNNGIIQLDLFSDDNGDIRYVQANDTLIRSKTDLGEGNSIAYVCTYNSGSVNERCLSADNSRTDITSVDIVFRRPDPAALIKDSVAFPPFRNEVRVYIKSALGDKVRIVKVFGSGQISVGLPVDVSQLPS